MHVPSQSSHDAVPPTPPAIVEQASKADQDRLKQKVIEVAGVAYTFDVQTVVPAGEEGLERTDLRDEIKEATDRVNDERNRPAEVRRARPARGKRGR